MKPPSHPATDWLQSGGMRADNGENRSLLLVMTGDTRMAVTHEISQRSMFEPSGTESPL